MFKHLEKRSRLNKAFRIGYLKMKKKYGDDEVQEEAAEIWKLTSEEKDRISKEEDHKLLSTAFVDQLTELFECWRDRFTDDEWKWIETNVFQTAELYCAISNTDEEVVQFLDDITPVRLRIRKLTPLECFRLMGLSDEEARIIAASGVSNSAQYKLAGNSIVVDVLFHIFRKMFIETEPDVVQGEATQLSLF